jgi:PAS domain S-box-containing protein
MNCPAKFRYLKSLVLSLLFCFAAPAYSQSTAGLEGERILILHGVWSAQFWEWEFDSRFQELLGQLEDSEIHISPVYLGVAQNPTPEALIRQAENIEAIIIEQDVDLIVAVLPPAIEFLNQLTLPPDLPLLLVLPEATETPQFAGNQVTVVPSALRTAIEGTLEEILTLLPETSAVEVMVGNGPGDLSYLERFQDVAAGFQSRLSFNYTVGVPRDALLDEVRALTPGSVIVNLSFESSGPEFTQEVSDSLQRLTDAAQVPVFGFYDSLLRYGIAGGHLTSVRDYATQAVELSLALLRGDSVATPQGRASSIYNWDRIQHWNLPVDRLGDDVEILGQPTNLFQDYPTFSMFTLNIIALLIIGLLFLMYRYQQLEQARNLIAKKEQQVRESELRYRLVTDNVADIIWVWEEGSDTLKYCSPAIERVTGFTVNEVLQIPISQMMSEEDFRQIAASFAEPDVPMLTRQIQLNHKNGYRVWAELAVQVARTLDSGKREWVGVSRDITQRKQNEIERKHLEDQIRQTQKLESLGTLAGGIAHDFNNILTVIIGITDMLRLESDGKESSTRLLDRLHKAADKARVLVQQILTFSRQSRRERTAIEFNDLLQRTLGLLNAGTPDNVQLQADLPEEKLNLIANSNQLEQIVINLVTNAIEAVAESGGEIQLSASSRSVKSATSLTHGQLLPGNYICLKVQDNGKGMSLEQMDKAFDPFYTSKELGSGMGLAIVHGIVMDHGGAIDITSQPDRGTSVQILLPASTTTQVATQSVMPAAEAGKKSKRIIVVDDQVELLQVVAEMLQQLGHDCITCADPKEALEVIKQQSTDLDLIITDYAMPEMNGVELMEQCQHYCPNIPVIISTGYAEHSSNLSRMVNQDIGRFGVLDKPYDLAKLRKVVESAASPVGQP